MIRDAQTQTHVQVEVGLDEFGRGRMEDQVGFELAKIRTETSAAIDPKAKRTVALSCCPRTEPRHPAQKTALDDMAQKVEDLTAMVSKSLPRGRGASESMDADPPEPDAGCLLGCCLGGDRLTRYIECSCPRAAARRCSLSMVGLPRYSVVGQATGQDVLTLSRAAFPVRDAWLDALLSSITTAHALCTAGRYTDLGASGIWDPHRGQRRDHREVCRVALSCFLFLVGLLAWSACGVDLRGVVVFSPGLARRLIICGA